MPSCSKYLEKEPDNRAALDTPQKVSQLLATAYPGANYVPMVETSTDNVGDIGSGDAGSADLNTLNADLFFFKEQEPLTRIVPNFIGLPVTMPLRLAMKRLMLSVKHQTRTSTHHKKRRHW